MGAIATTYRGINYRSRLEARWAAFFTEIGWEFVYEPFDGDGYIPDFLIEGPAPMLVEVKSAATQADYRKPVDKMRAGLFEEHSHLDWLIVGSTFSSPFETPLGGWAGGQAWSGGKWFSSPTAGLMFQANSHNWWSAGAWAECFQCHSVAVVHDEAGYNHRPCDHYDGSVDVPNVAHLKASWAAACNDVQWKGVPASDGARDDTSTIIRKLGIGRR